MKRTHLTYREIGTTVLSTMMYEKKTRIEMTVAPACTLPLGCCGLPGIMDSQGR